jgi:Lambda phage tail tube protein, TTP
MTTAALPNATNGNILSIAISSTQTTIARRTSIKPPPRTRDPIDTTDLDSTDDMMILGIRKTGEAEFTFNLDPNGVTDAYLESSYNAGTIESFVYKLKNSTTSGYAFSGGITSYELGEAKVNGLSTATLKVKPTGVTPGTAAVVLTV